MRLAGLYLEKQNYSRATLYLNRVANINPDSADVYYSIAQAEEGQYRFAAAAQAYARAVSLAPNNNDYRRRYEAFKVRVDRNRVTGDGGPGLNSRERVTGDRGPGSGSDGRRATDGRTVTQR